MTRYQLDSRAQTARVGDQEVDINHFPILGHLLNTLREDGITTLSYCDGSGMGNVEGDGFFADWGPDSVSITVPWDTSCDLEEAYDTLTHLARYSRDRLPHALDRSAKILGPVHAHVSFGETPYVSVYRGAIRVAATAVDEHLDLPMRDILHDWCAEMSAYARGVHVRSFRGALLSKDSVMLRDADLVQHRPEDAPGTEALAVELQDRFDNLLALIDYGTDSEARL